MAFTALIIMDGFGLTSNTEGNAIYSEGTPNIKKLMEEYPNTQIGASGQMCIRDRHEGYLKVCV